MTDCTDMKSPLCIMWDTAERSLIDALLSRARLNPALANQPWTRLSADVKTKLEAAYSSPSWTPQETWIGGEGGDL